MSVRDLVFPVSGHQLPADHSYPLFGALCRRQPAFHHNAHPVGVFPISQGQLRLRLPAEKMGEGRALEGARLELDGARIRLGQPRVESVAPASRLHSPWVTFSEAGDAQGFADRLRQLVGGLDVVCGPRDTRLIKGMKVAGFAVTISGLAPEQSAQILHQGLGGRRHFGGGLFLPPNTADSLGSPQARRLAES